MGWPVPTASEFAVVRHQGKSGASKHRHRFSPGSSHGVPGCKGRPNLQRNDDLGRAVSRPLIFRMLSYREMHSDLLP